MTDEAIVEEVAKELLEEEVEHDELDFEDEKEENAAAHDEIDFAALLSKPLEDNNLGIGEFDPEEKAAELSGAIEPVDPHADPLGFLHDEDTPVLETKEVIDPASIEIAPAALTLSSVQQAVEDEATTEPDTTTTTTTTNSTTAAVAAATGAPDVPIQKPARLKFAGRAGDNVFSVA